MKNLLLSFDCFRIDCSVTRLWVSGKFCELKTTFSMTFMLVHKVRHHWETTLFSYGCLSTQSVSDFSSLTLTIACNREFFLSIWVEESVWGIKLTIKSLRSLRERHTVADQKLFSNPLLNPLCSDAILCCFAALFRTFFIVGDFLFGYATRVKVLWWSATSDEKGT